MAAEGREVTAGAAAVLARRKDRPPLPRSLREAANEETSDEEWCAAEEQCEEDHETRIFLPASKYGRVRIHQAPRAQKEGTGEERRNALLGKGLGRRTVQLHGLAPSGDAAFEAVDEVGREAFEPGEQGAQDHEDAFIEYLSGNIDDAGAEVRSLIARSGTSATG